ncbi:uncharacterized protein LOC132546074 [Ylistrum balloti]|uniref:uncharacterized protein LOC132546074 n=1 Tax=Ylistrum balloti TaxID=509963 RepID=UPI0029059EBB|nr:uncharacterized protein LOC132546074 [Ylistrum balloti]
MAEGPVLENPRSNDTINLSARRLLECSICLEQMRQPKSLPCLHSFCEDCLGAFIITDLSGDMAAAISFPCPVCRKITSPIDHSKSKETWAQQFPVNSLVQNLNSLKMVTDNSYCCGPCKKTKNLQTPATFFCKMNKMLFCDFCKESFHDVVHEDCNIALITENNWKALLKQRDYLTCSIHKEMIDYFCESHKFIGCSKCITTDHRRCTKVSTTEEYCEKQKNNSCLDEMDMFLEEASNCIERMLIATDGQVETMQNNRDIGLSSILDLRQKMNTYLDNKQEEITQELISQYKLEKARLDLKKQKCTRLRTAIQNTKEASKVAAQVDDKIEMIQLFLRAQTEILACNDLIDDMKQTSKFVSITHDASFSAIDQTSTLSLGGILVEEESCSLPDDVEYIPNVAKLTSGHVEKLGTFSIDTPSDSYYSEAHGVVMLSNGNVVVCDYGNDQLKLFSFEGQCLDVLEIDGWPHDLCLMNDYTVAVAVSERGAGVHVATILASKLALLTVINIPEECYGIAFIDGVFIVSISNGTQTVTLKGETAQVHAIPAASKHLTSNPDEKHTFASLETPEDGGVEITKLTADAHTCVLRSGLVKGAMGVDVDKEGNLYVCGQASNNVVMVSACGTKIRELLTSKDGINSPRAISVCGDKFVVTTKASEKEQDIHLYQL